MTLAPLMIKRATYTRELAVLRDTQDANMAFLAEMLSSSFLPEDIRRMRIDIYNTKCRISDIQSMLGNIQILLGGPPPAMSSILMNT